MVVVILRAMQRSQPVQQNDGAGLWQDFAPEDDTDTSGTSGSTSGSLFSGSPVQSSSETSEDGYSDQDSSDSDATLDAAPRLARPTPWRAGRPQPVAAGSRPRLQRPAAHGYGARPRSGRPAIGPAHVRAIQGGSGAAAPQLLAALVQAQRSQQIPSATEASFAFNDAESSNPQQPLWQAQDMGLSSDSDSDLDRDPHRRARTRDRVSDRGPGGGGSRWNVFPRASVEAVIPASRVPSPTSTAPVSPMGRSGAYQTASEDLTMSTLSLKSESSDRAFEFVDVSALAGSDEESEAGASPARSFVDSFGDGSSVGSPRPTQGAFYALEPGAEAPSSFAEVTAQPLPITQKLGAARLKALQPELRFGQYALQESKASAASAVATHRDFLWPCPLTHVKNCLDSRGEIGAVLDTSGPIAKLLVLWLGAPESVLPPITAPCAKPLQLLRAGLSQEPPLGRRGASAPPLVGELALGALPPGTELLAATFNTESLQQRPLADRAQSLLGYIVAGPAQGGEQVRPVVFYTGPKSSLQWRQELCRVRGPRAQFSPLHTSIVVQSVAPGCGDKDVERVSDGVWVFINQPGPRPNTRRWQPRYAHSMAQPRAPVPTFVWGGQDRQMVMCGESGALIFDVETSLAVRNRVRLPVPTQLQGCTGIAGGAISFDSNERFVAINWSGHHPQQGIKRWGNVTLIERPALGSAQANPPVITLDHHPAQLARPDYRMVHFIGPGRDALFAYDASLYSARLPELSGAMRFRPYQRSGQRLLQTFERDTHVHVLHPNGFFAMVTADGMRLYYPTGNNRFGRGRMRYPFAEGRPLHLEALASRGIEPSANVLTQTPWMERSGRFVFAGFDGDVVHRWDLQPGRGHHIPSLVPWGDPDHPALRRSHMTPWSIGYESA